MASSPACSQGGHHHCTGAYRRTNSRQQTWPCTCICHQAGAKVGSPPPSKQT